jgi:Cu/Ag efflux protein CusF
MMGHDHGSAGAAAGMSMSRAPKSALAEGEVRKVDAIKGTVILRHGPLDALGMPPMTMEFKPTDPKLLTNIKAGDRVRFTPLQGRNGELMFSTIEVVKG